MKKGLIFWLDFIKKFSNKQKILIEKMKIEFSPFIWDSIISEKENTSK